MIRPSKGGNIVGFLLKQSLLPRALTCIRPERCFGTLGVRVPSWCNHVRNRHCNRCDWRPVGHSLYCRGIRISILLNSGEGDGQQVVFRTLCYVAVSLVESVNRSTSNRGCPMSRRLSVRQVRHSIAESGCA